MVDNIKNHKSEIINQKSDAAAAIDDDIVVGQKAAAKFIDVDEKTIQRWQKKGLPWSLRDRTKTYRKSDLKLFKDSEGATINPHKQREQISAADIKQTKAQLLELELKEKQGLLISKEDVEKKNIRQIITVRRKLGGLGRNLAPLLRAAGGDLKLLQSIVNTATKEICDLFVAEKKQAAKGTENNK
ncbi:MAG: hypothetical protein ABSG22_10655 [Sedimentisphaerales bacterium]|jgi:transposase